MSDLAKDLRIMAGMIQMCERISFGSDSALMEKAATGIERLERENSELKAKLDLLQDGFNIYCQTNWANSDPLYDGFNSTPAQCLSEVKAHAGMEGFIDGAHFVNAASGGVFAHDEIRHAAECYANQLRQQDSK